MASWSTLPARHGEITSRQIYLDDRNPNGESMHRSLMKCLLLPQDNELSVLEAGKRDVELMNHKVCNRFLDGSPVVVAKRRRFSESIIHGNNRGH